MCVECRRGVNARRQVDSLAAVSQRIHPYGVWPPAICTVARAARGLQCRNHLGLRLRPRLHGVIRDGIRAPENSVIVPHLDKPHSTRGPWACSGAVGARAARRRSTRRRAFAAAALLLGVAAEGLLCGHIHRGASEWRHTPVARPHECRAAEGVYLCEQQERRVAPPQPVLDGKSNVALEAVPRAQDLVIIRADLAEQQMSRRLPARLVMPPKRFQLQLDVVAEIWPREDHYGVGAELEAVPRRSPPRQRPRGVPAEQRAPPKPRRVLVAFGPTKHRPSKTPAKRSLADTLRTEDWRSGRCTVGERCCGGIVP
mmetsp:Transcript_7318/g.23031  ORF Transcript_7318/g.23031 Transcript_7318/m.23031 type:complete len:313 (-) Transcript_7318:305-1243(-)